MAKFDAEGFIRDLCSEIQKEIVRMELIDTGALLASLNNFTLNGNTATITLPDYAEALEYGTYEFSSKSETDYPENAGDSLSKKKKDMPPELAKRLPTGMIPFAFIRRVIYNKDLMTKLVEKNMTN